MSNLTLVIAEKPSVAKTIAGVLGANEKNKGYYSGNGYFVSWCIGHLISLSDAAAYSEQYRKWNYADLPIVPQKWQYRIAPDKEQQFSVIQDLMHRTEVSEIVNACDSGREGELIFRFVYEMAGCKKPIRRLWISSMEDSAIRKGFANLKDGREYDNLYQSALCRTKADWLIGINATRLFSILYHKTLNVGRVQTPTLAMIVQKDFAIQKFKKEKYCIVRLQAGDISAFSDKLTEKAAQEMKAVCEQARAVCTTLKKENKIVSSPKLFDLTSLQREANRLYGFTAKQALDYAQGLYEKRLLTYPRTDSRYITADMQESTENLVSNLCSLFPFVEKTAFAPETVRLVNDKKVSDHHAILPTAEFTKTGFSSLAESEKKLMRLVCARLLCAVSAPYEYEAVTAIFSCGDYRFTAKGRTTLHEGWREIDNLFRTEMKTKPDEEAEQEYTLPPIFEGQTFEQVQPDITEHYTQPPKAFTEDTLLAAMENAGKEDMPEDAERKGLGTTATRAATIEKLLSAGFVERSGKKLIPTKAGVTLVSVLPEVLTSPLLTAEWETRLCEIAKGNESPDAFMCNMENLTADLVKNYSSVSEDKENLFSVQREAIGTCPRCGAPVYEGKKNYYCSDRACSFVMWKNDRFFTDKKKAFTKAIAAALLKDGKVKVKGMVSTRTGKPFDGVVLLADTGGKYVNYRIEQTRK